MPVDAVYFSGLGMLPHSPCLSLPLGYIDAHYFPVGIGEEFVWADMDEHAKNEQDGYRGSVEQRTDVLFPFQLVFHCLFNSLHSP